VHFFLPHLTDHTLLSKAAACDSKCSGSYKIHNDFRESDFLRCKRTILFHDVILTLQ